MTTTDTRNGTPSRAELRADVLRMRGELAGTLDAIEDKLNLPRKFKRATREAKARLRVLADQNPAALAGLATGAIIIIGGTVFLIARGAATRR